MFNVGSKVSWVRQGIVKYGEIRNLHPAAASIVCTDGTSDWVEFDKLTLKEHQKQMQFAAGDSVVWGDYKGKIKRVFLDTRGDGYGTAVWYANVTFTCSSGNGTFNETLPFRNLKLESDVKSSTKQLPTLKVGDKVSWMANSLKLSGYITEIRNNPAVAVIHDTMDNVYRVWYDTCRLTKEPGDLVPVFALKNGDGVFIPLSGVLFYGNFVQYSGCTALVKFENGSVYHTTIDHLYKIPEVSKLTDCPERKSRLKRRQSLVKKPEPTFKVGDRVSWRNGSSSHDAVIMNVFYSSARLRLLPSGETQAADFTNLTKQKHFLYPEPSFTAEDAKPFNDKYTVLKYEWHSNNVNLTLRDADGHTLYISGDNNNKLLSHIRHLIEDGRGVVDLTCEIK